MLIKEQEELVEYVLENVLDYILHGLFKINYKINQLLKFKEVIYVL